MIRGTEYFDTESVTRDIKGKALRGGGAMLFSSTASTLIQFVSTVILARLLPPEDFGLVAMVTAISLLLANVGYNGFIEAIIHAEEIDHRQVSFLFWLGVGISFVLAVLFVSFSPFLADLYHEDRLIPIALIFSVGFLFYALTTGHLALIMRKMEFRKVVFNNILSILISTVIAIAMALKGFGYWALVARQMTQPMAAAIIVWLQCPWRPSWPRKPARVGSLLKYAANTFGNYAINYLGRNLDKVLLGWRWGAQELGNYDRAYRLFVLPVGQMVTPLASVALASLSRLKNDAAQFRRYYLHSLSIIAFSGMLVSAVLTVAGQDIIILLLGPQWMKAGRVFTAFGPSIGITLIYGTHSWLHLSLGTPDRWLRWSIFALVVTVAMFAACLGLGGLGIALAYALSYYLLTGPALRYAGRPIGIRMRDVWRQLWKYYVAALVSGFSTWLLLMKSGWFGSSPRGLVVLFRVLVTGILCAGLYLATVTVLFRSTRPIGDFIRVVREALSGFGSKSTRPSKGQG